MAFLDKITNMVDRTKARILAQYRNKQNFEAWQEIHSEFIQELENVYCDMLDLRTVDAGFGKILDEIGEIVVQPRLGFDDDFYRSLLKAKIGENTSQGEIEAIINVTKLLTQATQVHMQENFPAGFTLSVNAELEQTLINFYYERLNRVDSAGVRLQGLICYDADEPFAFEGEPGPASGFGDINDANTGGLFADFKVRTLPAFSFAAEAGVEDGDAGFGTIEDPLVGGIFQGL